MNQLIDFARQHWLELLLASAGLIFIAIAFWRRHTNTFAGWLVVGISAALFGAGGFVPTSIEPHTGLGIVGMWTVCAAFLLFVMLFVVLILTGIWSNLLGYLVGAAVLIGMGNLFCQPITVGLTRFGNLIVSLQPQYWWWLLLLLLVPLIIFLSYRSLAGLGPVRKWVAIGLRCLGITLLVFALAETHARHQSENLTVLFAWDQSLSVPREIEDGNDIRAERIRTFINDAVAQRGAGHERDQVGLVVFGRWPRLELPPSDVPKLNLKKILSKVDETYTDIGSAIKLSLASFPEGTSKRMVLVSDGNQNLGDALEQARIAKHNGVQIDVVMMATNRQKQNEVLVERVEVPPVAEKDARLPLRIVLRSHHPQPVLGTLILTRTLLEMKKSDKGDEAAARTEPILTAPIRLRQGLNTFYFQQPGSKKGESYIYEAKFIPKGLAGDRFENNHAEATVVARGHRAVLMIEPEIGGHQLLADRLRSAKSSLKVVSITPDRLPQNAAELTLVLSKFDSVILANVPADSFTEQQQQILRSNTHDQGCGLIMIGGPEGFGAGGWRGTAVEQALPVTCDLKSTKVEGKSGLVLIMHASEMAQGNFWQKKIARLAIEKLSAVDMVGLLYYDWQGGGHKWHVPFQQIGNNRGGILKRLDSMQPGDMPDADPSFKKAHDALANPVHALGTKHIIFISDGDHWGLPKTMPLIRKKKITCTTVCITTHGNDAKKKMAYVAKMLKGRAYYVTNPNNLPAIYTKEARLISKAFVYQKTFTPLIRFLSGPTEGLPKDLDPLHGFVRTTKRKSPLVNVPIQTPKIGKESPYPILAYWQYGLGKAVAFTSDARTIAGLNKRFWDHDWAGSGMYTKFWEQVVEWSLRSVETGRNLNMRTEYKDGKLRITVDARDDNKRPLTNVKLEAGVTSPDAKGEGATPKIKFEQVNAGVYEAEVKSEDIGAYFVHVRAKWKNEKGDWVEDGVRSGVTVPYSPEFAEMTSNVSLLEQIAKITGGNVYGDSPSGLRQVAVSGEVFRNLDVPHVSLQPIWFWLVLLAGVCLVSDVAVRRISVDPAKAWAGVMEVWAGLRGIQTERQESPQFLDRLKSRKSQVGEGLDRAKSAQRFDAEGAPVADVPTAMDAPASAPAARRQPKQAPRVSPDQQSEPADYASRLLKAKQKVWQERDKDKK